MRQEIYFRQGENIAILGSMTHLVNLQSGDTIDHVHPFDCGAQFQS